MTTQAIFNLESGRRKKEGKRRRHVTVDELLTLAYALGVAPIHLLVPIDGEDSPYAVTPNHRSSATVAREWIRGHHVLPGQDRRVYLSQVPEHEAG